MFYFHKSTISIFISIFIITAPAGFAGEHIKGEDLNKECYSELDQELVMQNWKRHFFTMATVISSIATGLCLQECIEKPNCISAFGSLCGGICSSLLFCSQRIATYAAINMQENIYAKNDYVQRYNQLNLKKPTDRKKFTSIKEEIIKEIEYLINNGYGSVSLGNAQVYVECYLDNKGFPLETIIKNEKQLSDEKKEIYSDLMKQSSHNRDIWRLRQERLLQATLLVGVAGYGYIHKDELKDVSKDMRDGLNKFNPIKTTL